MKELDIDKLEELAKEATQGDWEALLGTEANEEHGDFWVVSLGRLQGFIDGLNYGLGLTIFETTDINSKANAKHIAACGPTTILALIKRLRVAEVDAKRWDMFRNRYTNGATFRTDDFLGVLGPEADAIVDGAIARKDEGNEK